MNRMAICCFLIMSLSSFADPQEITSPDADSIATFQMEEVIITGTRTVKKILDIPYSVDRIDNTQYRFEKKNSVSDVLEAIPGLFMQSRYGNHDVRISIRGFGSRSNSGIRGVRILLDGIPESEPDGQTRIEAIDFQSVGSIEIVKGNASSLYTNAPGGVINFLNDITFPQSFAVLFSEAGSFAMTSNGVKAGVRSDNLRFLTSYNYKSSRGYRQHSEDHWHILNTVLETSPAPFSRLNVYGYFVDGIIRLPGSITSGQFVANPFQPNDRDASRDAKRVTKKGRVGIQYGTFLGGGRESEVELTTYGTIKYFERTARTYRVMNRYGLGVTGRFVHRGSLAGHPHEFTAGTDLFYQTGPVEEYNNINGKKGDILAGLTDEAIANAGVYALDIFSLIPGRLDVLISGRYDKVTFDQKNQILEVQNATRRFEAITPKVALNYKFSPRIACYGSAGFSFDSPAGNELENYPTSSVSTSILNPDLEPQKSVNFELGIKGNLTGGDLSLFRSISFDLTLFHTTIRDEIVPFEVSGDVFFRNSAKTNRKGIETGTAIGLLQGLRLKTAYTYSDFSYKEYVARTIGTDTSGNTVTLDQSFAGNVVPSVPRHNLSLILSYENGFSDMVTGFAKASYCYLSGMFADDKNSEQTSDYQTLSSTVGVDVALGRFNILLSGGVNNIFDKRYVAFLNINSTSLEFYEAGEPRNAFASCSIGYTF